MLLNWFYDDSFVGNVQNTKWLSTNESYINFIHAMEKTRHEEKLAFKGEMERPNNNC